MYWLVTPGSPTLYQAACCCLWTQTRPGRQQHSQWIQRLIQSFSYRTFLTGEIKIRVCLLHRSSLAKLKRNTSSIARTTKHPGNVGTLKLGIIQASQDSHIDFDQCYPAHYRRTTLSPEPENAILSHSPRELNVDRCGGARAAAKDALYTWF